MLIAKELRLFLLTLATDDATIGDRQQLMCTVRWFGNLASSLWAKDFWSATELTWLTVSRQSVSIQTLVSFFITAFLKNIFLCYFSMMTWCDKGLWYGLKAPLTELAWLSLTGGHTVPLNWPLLAGGCNTGKSWAQYAYHSYISEVIKHYCCILKPPRLTSQQTV